MENDIKKQLKECCDELRRVVRKLELREFDSIHGLVSLLKSKYKSEICVEFLNSFSLSLGYIESSKSSNLPDYYDLFGNDDSYDCDIECPSTYLSYEEIDDAINSSIDLIIEDYRKEKEDNSLDPKEILDEYKNRIYEASESLNNKDNKVKILSIAGVISEEADALGITEHSYKIMNKLYNMVLHNKLDIDIEELMSYVA